MNFFCRIGVLLIPIVFILGCNPSRKKQFKADDQDSFYSEHKVFKLFSKRFIDSVKAFFPGDFNGTILMYKDGRLFKQAIGYRDLKKQSKMKIDDDFQLASVSKTVTAVAVMLLVQDKKINLDSPVLCYMKDFPYEDVTVRQLLNHRSGLANYMYFTDTFWKDTSRMMNNQDFYEFMIRNKPKPYLKPGISFSYCNTNFAFLAVLVSRVSGLPFHQFVEERIFKPSGMRNSYLLGYRSQRITARELTGRYDQYEYDEPYYMDGILGDKSLYSNVEDLFAFHLALSEGRLLNKELLNQMEQPSYDYNVFGGSYGLGFRLIMTPQGQWTYHNGWWRGFWTSFWNRFDKKACFIILTNNKRSSCIDKQGIANLLLRGN